MPGLQWYLIKCLNIFPEKLNTKWKKRRKWKCQVESCKLTNFVFLKCNYRQNKKMTYLMQSVNSNKAGCWHADCRLNGRKYCFSSMLNNMDGEIPPTGYCIMTTRTRGGQNIHNISSWLDAVSILQAVLLLGPFSIKIEECWVPQCHQGLQ